MVRESGLRLPDGTATGRLAWLIPPHPLPPLVSINQRDCAQAATEGNSELGQLAKSRQHRPQGGGERYSAGFEPHCISALNTFGMMKVSWETIFTCPHAHSWAQPLAWPVTLSAAGGTFVRPIWKLSPKGMGLY